MIKLEKANYSFWNARRIGVKAKKVDYEVIEAGKKAKNKLVFISNVMNARYKNDDRPSYRDFLKTQNKMFYFELAEIIFNNARVRIAWSSYINWRGKRKF